jgi:bifunctional oligoribonuclease and PAP phosphatase NrnA
MDGGGHHLEAYTRVADAILNAYHILVAAHRNPDGDALGSLLGLYHILGAIGKTPTAFCPDEIPDTFRFLPGCSDIKKTIGSERFDATVLLDTPESALLPEGFPEPSRRGIFVVIDHHMKAETMGDAVLRVPASAVGEILERLASFKGWPVNRRAAVCLYTAIVADTSSFKYESATPASHRTAATLIAAGASPVEVSTHLFETCSLRRRRLLAGVLSTLTVCLDGALAMMHCTLEMLRSTGAEPADTGGLINFARAIDGVVLAVFLREQPDGAVRVSIRSKGKVNAAELAERLGGGGHVNAGGCTLSDVTLASVAARIEAEAEPVLRKYGALR